MLISKKCCSEQYIFLKFDVSLTELPKSVIEKPDSIGICIWVHAFDSSELHDDNVHNARDMMQLSSESGCRSKKN